jgi:mannose-1-phosphate guanylyltransferase
VEDLVVVDSGDALMVCGKERAQEVKIVVQELEKRGLNEYL